MSRRAPTPRYQAPALEKGLDIVELLHEKARLAEWIDTVPDFEPYEAGSEAKGKKVPR